MDSKRHPLTPQKRSNESSEARFKRRTQDTYKLKVLLPNGTAVMVKIPDGMEFISVKELADRVKKEPDKAVSNSKKHVKWDADLCFLDDSDNVFKNSLKLTNLELNRVYNLRLHDGSRPAEIYENMWDLTPDTELLMELPEEYTFETALADLIDNSLQAVWSNDKKERGLIRVEVADDKISIVDTGPGMDSMSIEKWGKMGASLHRASKAKAIGGKPPYLKPAFGMYGYGGFIASMHLGSHTEVSSKTNNCKKVYMLRLERDALVSASGSKRNWRTYGSLRDPTEDEHELSSGGSFTKVDIFEPNMRSINIRRLQCKLKDIYFPYIQCDELSKKGRTTMPIEFQVNGDDLAEIPGGEVAITNLNSCNGPEFILQIRFHLNHDNATMSSPGARPSDEANARLRCVYLPVKEGKESIQNILETLKEDGYEYTEEYGSFSHVSCRRLGRLLPEARWSWLPFMDFRQRKEDRSQVLKRSSMRVKCFIETDAGFSPTPSKTDFAHQNPYTTALRNLGSRQVLERETGVQIEIRRDGKTLNLSQLDKQYRQWLVDMHQRYDEEVDCGVDEPIFMVNPINSKDLHISENVVRVHKALLRKGKTWESGQRIKILKGACAGFHKNNVYATLEYILLEGFQGDAGEAWIICRTIDVSEEDGCLLKFVNGNPTFDLRKSISIPINVIDSGKCLAIDDSEWSHHLENQYKKSPSSIEILDTRQCHELGIDVSLLDEPEVYAGHVSTCGIVAVVRPATFRPGTASKHLDQKYVIKDNFEMSLAIKYSRNGKSKDQRNIYSGRVTPSSQRGIHGLYVFQPKCGSNPLFHSAGIYTFTFSLRDSSCQECVVKVRVKPSHEIHRWALAETSPRPPMLTVGCCKKPFSVAMFDSFENQIPFLKVPEMVIEVNCTKGAMVQVQKWNPSISSDKLSLILEDLLIRSSNLDNIRPNYEATLKLFLPDGSPLLDIPVRVFPGPVDHVTVQPESFEKQLIPDHVIKELILELFDEYGNHLQKDQKVQLAVDGFCFLERSCSLQKVDASGCIDLGGLLRVTAGYGRNVSLSVSSDGGVVISNEWQIERRQLRTASVIPESCFAGSKLENLVFEVVNSKGEVDVNFHDEDSIGQSHTLVLKSHFLDIDESVKYAFREGLCIVRAVPIPLEEGDFSFVVSHSRHLELQLTVKVHVELSPEMEPLSINQLPPEMEPLTINQLPPEMEPLTINHLSTNENFLPLMDSSASVDTQMDYRSDQCHVPETNPSSLVPLYCTRGVETELESWLEFKKNLEDEIVDFRLRICQHEELIDQLQRQQRVIESNLSELKVARDEILGTPTDGSAGKDEIVARIERRTDSAAALVMKLFRKVSDWDLHGLIGRIIGVVALLGTTPTLELSRIFAEYLGDEMLAVVCKSYEDLHLLETYKKNGRLDSAHGLHMYAAELGRSINGRYHVLCIEDIRPCTVHKDLKGKFVLPNPTLPNGATPAGFLGYAINMINVDVDHQDTRTDSGYHLQETLFYRLFGKTQVYESREDMERAICCIKDGAVSLDGGILRGNGSVHLGRRELDIIFPVARERNQNVSHVLRRYSETKVKLKETMSQLMEEKRRLEKAWKKCSKRQEMYVRYFTRNQVITSSSTPVAYSEPEEKPNICSHRNHV